MTNIFTPGPTPNTVRTADCRILTAPKGWILLPPGDAALTRRVKEAGEHWVVQEKKGRKILAFACSGQLFFIFVSILVVVVRRRGSRETVSIDAQRNFRLEERT
jgi:hypothetical protein